MFRGQVPAIPKAVLRPHLANVAIEVGQLKLNGNTVFSTEYPQRVAENCTSIIYYGLEDVPTTQMRLTTNIVTGQYDTEQRSLSRLTRIPLVMDNLSYNLYHSDIVIDVDGGLF